MIAMKFFLFRLLSFLALRQIRYRFRQGFLPHRSSLKELCSGAALGDPKRKAHATAQRRDESKPKPRTGLRCDAAALREKSKRKDWIIRAADQSSPGRRSSDGCYQKDLESLVGMSPGPGNLFTVAASEPSKRKITEMRKRLQKCLHWLFPKRRKPLNSFEFNGFHWLRE